MDLSIFPYRRGSTRKRPMNGRETHVIRIRRWGEGNRAALAQWKRSSSSRSDWLSRRLSISDLSRVCAPTPRNDARERTYRSTREIIRAVRTITPYRAKISFIGGLSDFPLIRPPSQIRVIALPRLRRQRAATERRARAKYFPRVYHYTTLIGGRRTYTSCIRE